MKATGIVRCIDPQGRVVLPKELRMTLNIDLNDPIEIYTNDDSIILRKYSHQCAICSNMDEIINFKNKSICKRCISELK